MGRIAEIAERIAATRDLCSFTPEEMAESTDTTVQQYLEIESGKREFDFTFLYKCAKKFGVDIVELLKGDNPHLDEFTIVHDGDGLSLQRAFGFEYYHLASDFKGKISEPFLVKAKYRPEEQNTPIHTTKHSGQEFDYVLRGSLKFHYDGHEENLIAGDSVYYNSGKPHGMIATSRDGCDFIAIVMKDGLDEEH